MNKEKTMTKKTETKTTIAIKQKTTVVYTGPTIPGVATANTIFNNGIPDELKVLAEQLPVVKELLVPVEKVAKVKANLRDSKSATSIYYEKVLQYVKGRER